MTLPTISINQILDYSTYHTNFPIKQKPIEGKTQ